MGNVAGMIMFRLGPKDARALAAFTGPHLNDEALANLDEYHAVAKLQRGGKTEDAFLLETTPPPPELDDADERVADIRQRSRTRYARPCHDVEAALREAPFGPDNDEEDYLE